MKKSEIQVGGKYIAKVSNKLVTVRVDAINEFQGFRGSISGRRVRSETSYTVTNLTTGRQTRFRSASKFRSKVEDVGELVRPVFNTTTENNLLIEVDYKSMPELRAPPMWQSGDCK